jgi:hypothetical protein
LRADKQSGVKGKRCTLNHDRKVTIAENVVNKNAEGLAHRRRTVGLVVGKSMVQEENG